MNILGKTKTKILIELGKGDLHGYELARKIGIPVSGIYYHLKELAAEDFIASKELGRRKIYYLSPKGEKLTSILQESKKNTKNKN